MNFNLRFLQLGYSLIVCNRMTNFVYLALEGQRVKHTGNFRICLCRSEISYDIRGAELEELELEYLGEDYFANRIKALSYVHVCR